MPPKKSSGRPGPFDVEINIGVVGEEDLQRLPDMLKTTFEKVAKMEKQLENQAKKTGKAINESFGTRPTDTSKPRTRKTGKVAADEMAESLDKVQKGAKKTTTGIQRLFFQLGLLRFGINVASFAFQTFLGVLRFDAIKNYAQAVNFAETNFLALGLTAEQTSNKLAEIERGFKGRKDLITRILGDPETITIISNLAPGMAEALAFLALQAHILEGRDPAKFFNAMAKAVTFGDLPGALDELAEMFSFGPEFLEAASQGGEALLKFLESQFNVPLDDAVLEAADSFESLQAKYDEFVAHVLTPIALPVLTFAVDAVTEFFKQLRFAFSDGGEDYDKTFTAFGLAGSALVGALIGTLFGGPLGGMVGALAGANLFAKFNKFLVEDHEGRLGDALAALGRKIATAFKDAFFAVIEFFIKLLPAKIEEPLLGVLKTIENAIDVVLDKLGLLERKGATGIQRFQNIGAPSASRQQLIGIKIASFNNRLGVLNQQLASGVIDAETWARETAPIQQRIQTLQRQQGGSVPVPKPGNPPDVGNKPVIPGIDDIIKDPSKLLPGSPPDVERKDFGGVVSGPRGAPRMVLAHGGETFVPTHRGGFNGNAEIVIMIDKKVLGRTNIDLLNTFIRQHSVVVPGTISS